LNKRISEEFQSSPLLFPFFFFKRKGKKAKEKEMNRKEEQRKERPSFFLVFEDSFCEDV
jgi:hypothetical protein